MESRLLLAFAELQTITGVIQYSIYIPGSVTADGLPISSSGSKAVPSNGTVGIDFGGPTRGVGAGVELNPATVGYPHTTTVSSRFSLAAGTRNLGYATSGASGSADATVSATAVIRPEGDEIVGDDCVVWVTVEDISWEGSTDPSATFSGLVNSIPGSRKFTAKIGDTITIALHAHSHVTDAAVDPGETWINWVKDGVGYVGIDVEPPPPVDLLADTITSSSSGDYNIAYSVVGNLTQATSAKVFWSKDTTFAGKLSGTPIFSQSIVAGDRGGGSQYSATVPKTSLANPPEGAKYLVMVLDDVNTVVESNESNNSSSIRFKRLSGAAWAREFPGSKSLSDLDVGFQLGVSRFIGAIEAAGGRVSVESTYRPPERAWLMHYSWLIAMKRIDPRSVPEYAGVNIEWWHGDLTRSIQAASDMVSAFEISKKLKVAPSLTSRHTEKLAIDMNVTWRGSLRIIDANGKMVLISSGPKNHTNTNLIRVAKTFGVIHFTNIPKDPNHWSVDGH